MEEESRKAIEKAMNLLLQQQRTKKGLQDRLSRTGFSEKAVEEAMAYVMSFGYIDDLHYANTYIEYYRTQRSKKELQYKLMDRGVPKEIIAEAFLEYDDESENEAAKYLIKKRLKGRTISSLEFKEKNKITAYLGRKGYRLPGIRSLMKEMEEMEEIQEEQD